VLGRIPANLSPLATGGESAQILGVDYQGYTSGHLEVFGKSRIFLDKEKYPIFIFIRYDHECIAVAVDRLGGTPR
jgi:hypothetical protein